MRERERLFMQCSVLFVPNIPAPDFPLLSKFVVTAFSHLLFLKKGNFVQRSIK